MWDLPESLGTGKDSRDTNSWGYNIIIPKVSSWIILSKIVETEVKSMGNFKIRNDIETKRPKSIPLTHIYMPAHIPCLVHGTLIKGGWIKLVS